MTLNCIQSVNMFRTVSFGNKIRFNLDEYDYDFAWKTGYKGDRYTDFEIGVLKENWGTTFNEQNTVFYRMVFLAHVRRGNKTWREVMESSEFIRELYKFDRASASEVKEAISKAEQAIADLKAVLVNIERNRVSRYLYDSGLASRGNE